MLNRVWLIAVGACLLFAGCFGSDNYPHRYGSESENIQFHDSVQTNVSLDQDVAKLSFVNVGGQEVKLADFLGSKSLVVVITRGYAGSICPYCSTQTSRLITNYPEFVKRNAEVVVVYPVETAKDTARLDEFLKVTREKIYEPKKEVPFPVLLDVELKAVDRLGIRKSLSKPATYILNKEGQVRFAYVGESLSDRPSVKAMLDQLDALNKETG